MVLVLVSMLLSLAAPSVKGFFVSRQAGDAAQMVLALTRCAHTQAVTRGQPCRLNVDERAGTVWLTMQEGGNYVDVPNSVAGKCNLPEGSTISLSVDNGGTAAAPVLGGLGLSAAKPVAPSASYIQFFPSGRSDVATIELRGRQGERYTIACPSATEGFEIISSPEKP